MTTLAIDANEMMPHTAYHGCAKIMGKQAFMGYHGFITDMHGI